MTSIGAAHHALRAYVWACNRRATEGVTYRFRLGADSAAVIDQNGDVLAEAPLSAWVSQGRLIRAALVGLKYMCDRIEHASALAKDFRPARLNLDALDNTAWIAVAEQKFSREDFLSRAKDWWLSEPAMSILADTTEEDFNTIKGWATLGRQLELDFFWTLKGAETYGLDLAVLAERERGYRIGILCRPKVSTDSSAGTELQQADSSA